MRGRPREKEKEEEHLPENSLEKTVSPSKEDAGKKSNGLRSHLGKKNALTSV